MAETGSDTRSGIGVRLRAGRERMGLTLLQAAEKLHVDAKVLESLESERFDLLGAPVFVRGHLKRYSELIGEQTSQLLDLYTESSKPTAPDLTRLPKAAPAAKPGRLAVPALLVLIAFVLFGVVWWVLKSLQGTGVKQPDPDSVAQIVPLDPALETAGPESDGSGAQTLGGTTGEPSGSAASATGSQGSGFAAGGVSRGGPAQGASGASAAQGAAGTQAAATGAAPASGAATAAAPARGKAMEVTLRFAADSWVEVYDASGEKLFYDIGSAESQRTITGTPPFRVTFGNAPGVTLDVNGKPATVPASAVSNETAQFVINRSGRIVRARQQAQEN